MSNLDNFVSGASFINQLFGILLVSAKDTNLVTKEIVKLFIGELPEITNAFLPEGGHMAPITCPQTVNSIIYKYLMREYFETIK